MLKIKTNGMWIVEHVAIETRRVMATGETSLLELEDKDGVVVQIAIKIKSPSKKKSK